MLTAEYSGRSEKNSKGEEEMQDFLNKLGKTAAAAAEKAGDKAGELIEVGKLKSKISSEKSDIASAEKEIGRYCYDLFKKGKLKDKTIKELCERMETCYNDIEELEKQIREEKAKNDDDPTI